jgi:ATP-dependent RNA helicase DeaD
VAIDSATDTVGTMHHVFLAVHHMDKDKVVAAIASGVSKTLVFCQTKRVCDRVERNLQDLGVEALAIHGDLPQVTRENALRSFAEGRLAVLVATDVAARGIDVCGIDVVFNYDLPWDEEDYVHRIGRTARAGKSGRSYTFVSSRDMRKLRDIQHFTGTRIRRQQIPTLRDVEASRQEAFIEKVNAILEGGLADRHLALAERLLSGDTPSLEVTAALVALLVGKDVPQAAESEFTYREDEDDGRKVTLVAAVGREHKVSPSDIVGAITGETGLPGRAIGAIRIFNQQSFIDVPASQAQAIIETLNRSRIRNVAPEMRLAEANEMPSDPPRKPKKGAPQHGYPGPDKKAFKKAGMKPFRKDHKRK